MKHIRKLSVYGYFICILLITGTLFWGAEIKGAKRWLSLFGFSFQPSELLKPIITVITAWLISEQYQDRKFPGILISIISILLVIPLLLLQPDIGILIVIVGTWFAQLFISGLSVFMIIVFLLLGISSMFALYFSLPHFANRIDRFITKSGDEVDFYQIKKSIEAFRNGGFGGKGPGEGVIKTLVPDSHSDFVFSIIGEEFGFVMCIIIICLFSILIVRTILRIMRFSNMFNLSVGFGILFQITLQVLINICTSLNLIPTKGTTLPFISYGGSSMLASAISFGIIFAITKKNALQKY
jgi:cell division protein FtsW